MQYSANQDNLDCFTNAIIILHANNPDTKADKNPIIKGRIAIPEEALDILPPINSKKASPRIGTRTIRNENCVTSSFFIPHSKPVEIVAPLRDKPGTTATA